MYLYFSLCARFQKVDVMLQSGCCARFSKRHVSNWRAFSNLDDFPLTCSRAWHSILTKEDDLWFYLRCAEGPLFRFHFCFLASCLFRTSACLRSREYLSNAFRHDFETPTFYACNFQTGHGRTGLKLAMSTDTVPGEIKQLLTFLVPWRRGCYWAA